MITSFEHISHGCVVVTMFFNYDYCWVRIGDNNLGVKVAVIPHVEIGNNNIIQAR
jgi:hypothetical protein